MPGVVWEAEQSVTMGAGDPPRKWTTAGPGVLDSLADWTGCDCAILRAEAADAQNLILEGYKFGQHVGEIAQFKIPQSKSLRFWNGNPFSSCIVQHHPNGTIEAHRPVQVEELPPEIKRFLSQVLWRGSFPLAIKGIGSRIAILISFEKQMPVWASGDEVVLAWLAGQLAVARLMTCHDESKEPVVQAARHLLALASFKSHDDRLATLLRILCSGRSLGWQRAWILRPANSHLECDTCCGGVTLAEWGEAAAFARSQFVDLVDEIAHEVIDKPRERDGLYRACVQEIRLHAEREWFDSDSRPKNEESHFLVPTELEFDAANHWKNRLLNITGKHDAHADDERFFACPLRIDTGEYVVVLAWSDERTGHEQPRLIETGVVLAVASHLMSEAKTVADFPQRLAGLLSWQGIEPLDPVGVERAKARRVRLQIENDPEIRQALAREMLEAAARRHGTNA